MNEYMKETNEALLHTYNQFPVVLERGEGAYLYDTEGKKYLDFAAGYAVSSLGYADKELNDALKEQIDKIFHTSIGGRHLQTTPAENRNQLRLID